MARLPEGYQEVEYIKYIPSKTYCIGGFSSQEEAEKRISELQTKCPSTAYKIGAQVEQLIKEYIIVIPEEAITFLSDDEKSTAFPEKPTLQCEEFSPTVYRFLPEKYIDSFFETGNLKITSFLHCKKLESKIRQDSNEGRGTALGVDGHLRCEIDSGIGDNALLLCTSLSKNNNLSMDEHYSAAIKIINLNGFIEAVTIKLINSGYCVSHILKGPCIYNDRIIQREINDQSLSNLIAEMENGNSFNFENLFALQRSIVSNDLFFSKPIEKSIENEYRILWLLDGELNEECIFIDVPEARQYCQKIVFNEGQNKNPSADN